MKNGNFELMFALQVKMQKLSAKEKENALNEVRILASVHHANIAGYKEAFFEESSSSLCIVSSCNTCKKTQIV